MSWLLVPLAGLLGAVLTTQIATNTELGKALGNPYSPAAAQRYHGAPRITSREGHSGVIAHVKIAVMIRPEAMLAAAGI